MILFGEPNKVEVLANPSKQSSMKLVAEEKSEQTKAPCKKVSFSPQPTIRHYDLDEDEIKAKRNRKSHNMKLRPFPRRPKKSQAKIEPWPANPFSFFPATEPSRRAPVAQASASLDTHFEEEQDPQPPRQQARVEQTEEVTVDLLDTWEEHAAPLVEIALVVDETRQGVDEEADSLTEGSDENSLREELKENQGLVSPPGKDTVWRRRSARLFNLANGEFC